MKKLFLASIILLLFACKPENKVEEKVSEIPVTFKVERFDKQFYESDSSNINTVKAAYPFLFPEGNEDSVWTNKLKNPLLQDLYKEVQKKYPTTAKIEPELEHLFQHIQYYFPDYKTPRVITVISEVDREAKAIYADQLVFIALDCYLGKDHPFYVDFSEYQRIGFEENQILPDLVTSFSYGKISRPLDRTLLSIMIYYGKELYLKDKLIPEYSDATKIGYTEQQLAWCKENEYQMWSYFIENNLLYESNVKNEFRFINEAPFSKFYLEIDNESPGRVGQWLGWQIVRSYMENNSISLDQLLVTDAKTIFEKSKYKPNK
ncbi:gliding motility lipoprotein GldB [Flavobacterium sp. J27]|uniref:gliding motility lipoprotein GldB n=1 Tax=Flavobacterium sp. J27 TaxID=2060419 RepID=UPI00103177D0|nr:gliding motility lipoprotein GldB [Flavobacterium sp. J27]